MTRTGRERAILVSSGNRSGAENIPLGLMSLATAMNRAHGLETSILDLPVERPGQVEAQVAAFWDEANLSDALFAGFATVCGTVPRTLSLARELRRRHRGLPIIFGGPDASSHPQALLRTYGFIDAVVVGEAEGVLGPLLQALHTDEWNSRPGLCFRDCVDGPFPGAAPGLDLKTIAPVDYSVYPPGVADETVALDVGRGCPYACTFCSTKDFFRRSFRMKPAERIVTEAAAILRNPKAKRIEFIHDMFTTNRKLVVEVCEALIASGLTFEWTCSARTDRVDRELLALMIRAGCRHIYFGIDTGSARLQRLIRKNLDLTDAEETLELALALGLEVTAAVLIGFPNEEKNDLLDTLDFAVRWGAQGDPRMNVQVHLVTPMAGTELAAEFADGMLYDGYVGARMVVHALTDWEEREVRRNPQLFQSFYYCRNPHIPRSVYKWIHSFLITGQISFPDLARHARLQCRRPGAVLLSWAQNMPPYPVPRPGGDHQAVALGPSPPLMVRAAQYCA